MTIKELIAELEKFDPSLKVVLTTIEDGNITAWELESISDGWVPSGILSLESTTCVMS